MVHANQQITFIYTTDLAASAHFYGEQLALPLVVDQGSCHIYRVNPAAYLGICTSEDAPSRAEISAKRQLILTWVVDDVPACYESLRDRGVSFESAPSVHSGFGIEHCFLRDPNGYLLEIQRFLDPNWHEALP
ncbi:MAG: VOC family protein [Anaerolineaceae bacterium]|nr:VOC family protein [Anaerolineaceae bacterium]